MPLVNVLAPQIARKLQEIEAEIGPPRPIATGYLRAGAPPAKPTASAKALQQLRADTAGHRPDQIMKAGAARGYAKEKRVAEIKLPNAPPRAPSGPRSTDDVVGMTEDGKPIHASESTPKPAKKRKGERTVLKLPAGAVGTNESGQAVDTRGKNLGYLKAQNPTRTLERRKLDVAVGEKNTYDQYGVQVLQERFGPHLKAVQENRDADGMPTDQFPPGYFNGMPAQGVEEIRKGVARLRELERGTAI